MTDNWTDYIMTSELPWRFLAKIPKIRNEFWTEKIFLTSKIWKKIRLDVILANEIS